MSDEFAITLPPKKPPSRTVAKTQASNAPAVEAQAIPPSQPHKPQSTPPKQQSTPQTPSKPPHNPPASPQRQSQGKQTTAKSDASDTFQVSLGVKKPAVAPPQPEQVKAAPQTIPQLRTNAAVFIPSNYQPPAQQAYDGYNQQYNNHHHHYQHQHQHHQGQQHQYYADPSSPYSNGQFDDQYYHDYDYSDQYYYEDPYDHNSATVGSKNQDISHHTNPQSSVPPTQKVQGAEASESESAIVCPCCGGDPQNCQTAECAERGFCMCEFTLFEQNDADADVWIPAYASCICCNGYINNCKQALPGGCFDVCDCTLEGKTSSDKA